MGKPIIKSIIVKGDINQIFNLWADFEKFPHFMKDVNAIEKITETRSHWIVTGPMGKDLKWDAQISDFQQNKRIGWHSVSGDIKISGQVTFNALEKEEVEITVTLLYIPPAGKLGTAAAKILDNPEKKLEESLREFKRYAENVARLSFETGTRH